MDNYEIKTANQKFGYLLYELVGTTFIVFVFNTLATGGAGAWDPLFLMALFAMTLISWDAGPAQFNSGTLLASLCYNFREFKESYKPFILVAAMQCLGTFLGYLLTVWITFERSWSQGENENLENFKYLI